MKRRTRDIWWYSFLFVNIILFDRLAKWYAIRHWQLPQQINQFLTFELTYNRGISWGLFHSSSNTLFSLVSTAIALVTVIVALFALQRIKQGYAVWGEFLVVSGSTSNLIDRVLYGGVVDFILISYEEWSWPVFNVADMAIVAGVMVMLWEQYKS